MKILPRAKGDHMLLDGLAERWWDTTNSFHFPIGEMTVTPKDFSMLTGLRVGGRPLLFDPDIADDKGLIRSLLGPSFMRDYSGGERIRCRLLYTAFQNDHCNSRAKVLHHTRAFILYLLGASLFANSDGNIHLGLLKSLEDVDLIGQFDWGGAALATLYANMGDLSRGRITCVLGFHPVWEVHSDPLLNSLVLH
jgi:hypothetical protein